MDFECSVFLSIVTAVTLDCTEFLGFVFRDCFSFGAERCVTVAKPDDNSLSYGKVVILLL